MPPRVLMIGLMGTGKSTVGRLLADALAAPFLDNDELVRQATGVEREELLRDRGEPALRAAESAALTAALEAPTPVVAAIAAGVVLDEGDRERLRRADAVLVWLRARPETLADRTAHDDERPPRPWLDADPVGTFRAMMRDRASWYEDLAHIIIDVDDLAPADIAGHVLARLPDAARTEG